MACVVSAETPPSSNGFLKKSAGDGDHSTTPVRTAASERPRVTQLRLEGGDGHIERNGGIPRRPPSQRHKEVHLKPMATIEEDDVHPPPSKCCCNRVSVQSGCRLVAVFSLLAAVANAALYCFGLSRLGLGAPIEIIVMSLDFIAAICLLIGSTKGSPSMLKPYLFFMAAWNVGLIFLLVSCLWKLITNRDFPRNAAHNLMELNRAADSPRVRHARHGQEGVELLLTFGLLLLLAVIIFIDCLFLHVAYRAFQYFTYRKDRAKEGRSVV